MNNFLVSVFRDRINDICTDECDIIFVPIEEFRSRTNGWMYPKNSILQPMFDKIMLKLYQNGVMEKLKEKYLPKPICNKQKSYPQVDFEFTKLIFFILFFGAISSVFLCIGEKILKVFSN